MVGDGVAGDGEDFQPALELGVPGMAVGVALAVVVAEERPAALVYPVDVERADVAEKKLPEEL